jgi:aspartate/methionine/tyrosine aminotransferase/amino acid transporter
MTSRFLADGGALRHNALNATDVIAMATATYAPTAALYFNTPIAASFAGSGVPFCFLLATVAMLIVAACMAQLARHQESAGGYYSWIRSALGQRTGFLVGWLVLAGSFLVVPGVYAAEGDYVSTILARYGVHLNWLIIALVLLVLITGVNILGVRPSVRTGGLILLVELVIVTVLCLVIVGKGGTAGNTAVPFKPPSGFGAIGGAMVFGVLSFIGFEAVTTTGEEASRARRNVPRALFLAVIIGGVFLTLGSYAASIGFGVNHVSQLSGNAAPFDTLAERFADPGFRLAIDIAGVTSFTASVLLTTLAVSRIYYAMARDRLLPGFLGNVSPRYKTPAAAILAEGALALVLFLALGLWVGPMNTYAYLGTVLTFAMVPVYVLILASTVVVFWTSLRHLFNPVRHVVLPFIGAAVIVYPLWSLSPLGGPQSPPYDYLPLVVLGYLIAGIVLTFVLRHRFARAEAVIGRAAFEEGTEPSAKQPTHTYTQSGKHQAVTQRADTTGQKFLRSLWEPEEADEPITRQMEALLEEQHPGGRLRLAGSPYVDLPAHVVEAIAASAGGRGYTSSLGDLTLRQAIAGSLEERGVRVSAGQVLVTNGAMHALDLVFRAVLRPGNEVLMPGPGFFIGGLVRRADARLVQFPSAAADGFRPLWADARKLVTSRTRILYVNTPVNPTGYVYDEADLAAAAELAQQAGLILVSDESLSRFVYGERRHSSPIAKAAKGVLSVLVGSFSKDYALPGMRVGYAVLPEALFPVVSALLEWSVLCVSRPGQAAALAALTGPSDWLAQMVKDAEARGARLASALNAIPGLSCVPPKGGLNVFPRFDGDAEHLARHLVAEFGVPVAPGSAFGSLGHFRIQFGGVEHDLELAVNNIRTAITAGSLSTETSDR